MCGGTYRPLQKLLTKWTINQLQALYLRLAYHHLKKMLTMLGVRQIPTSEAGTISDIPFIWKCPETDIDDMADLSMIEIHTQAHLTDTCNKWFHTTQALSDRGRGLKRNLEKATEAVGVAQNKPGLLWDK